MLKKVDIQLYVQISESITTQKQRIPHLISTHIVNPIDQLKVNILNLNWKKNGEQAMVEKGKNSNGRKKERKKKSIKQ